MIPAALFQKTATLLLALAVAFPPLAKGNCCCVAKGEQHQACCQSPQKESQRASAVRECCRKRAAAQQPQRSEPCAPQVEALGHVCRCPIVSSERNTHVVRLRLNLNDGGKKSLDAPADRLVARQAARVSARADAPAIRTDHRPLQAVLCVWIV